MVPKSPTPTSPLRFSAGAGRRLACEGATAGPLSRPCRPSNALGLRHARLGRASSGLSLQPPWPLAQQPQLLRVPPWPCGHVRCWRLVPARRPGGHESASQLRALKTLGGAPAPTAARSQRLAVPWRTGPARAAFLLRRRPWPLEACPSSGLEAPDRDPAAPEPPA